MYRMLLTLGHMTCHVTYTLIPMLLTLGSHMTCHVTNTLIPMLLTLGSHMACHVTYTLIPMPHGLHCMCVHVLYAAHPWQSYDVSCDLHPHPDAAHPRQSHDVSCDLHPHPNAAHPWQSRQFVVDHGGNMELQHFDVFLDDM